MGMWVVSTLGRLWIRCHEHTCTYFCLGICFHSSWVYSQECHFWVMWYLCLTLWGPARLLSRAGAPFYIPPSNVWGIHFSPALPTHVIIFGQSLPSGWEVVSHCDFDKGLLSSNAFYGILFLSSRTQSHNVFNYHNLASLTLVPIFLDSFLPKPNIYCWRHF